MDRPACLYGCRCGTAAELGRLYFCAACSSVACAHPRCTTEEVEAFYCPACLENQHSVEAQSGLNRCSKCFECPACSNTLQVVRGEGSDHFLSCGYCRWTSKPAGLVEDAAKMLIVSAVMEERQAPQQEEFAALLEALHPEAASRRGSGFGGGLDGDGDAPPPPPGGRRRSTQALDFSEGDLKALVEAHAEEQAAAAWHWDDAERVRGEKDAALRAPPAAPHRAAAGAPPSDAPPPAELLDLQSLLPTTTLEQRLRQGAAPATEPSQLRPLRKPLRTKRSRRCLRCMAANRPGILVKAQVNPLIGDSSMRSSSLWFQKCSLARSVLPKLAVRAPLPTAAELAGGAPGRLVVALSNAMDSPATVLLAVAASPSPRDTARALLAADAPLEATLGALDPFEDEPVHVSALEVPVAMEDASRPFVLTLQLTLRPSEGDEVTCPVALWLPALA